MWDARPEQLKTYWTGRTVSVRSDYAMTPGPLKRFAGLVGRVRTVNMNGRALVQWDGPDETWFDLDPAVLKEVEPKPETPPPVRPAVGEEPKAAPHPPAPAKPRAGDGGGKKLSVLELARRQGAAKP